MRIDDGWLRTFADAAGARTFAEAAALRGVSPSAISQQIRALETELGVPLFARIGRRVKLTDEGAALLDEVRSALARIDGAIEAVVDRHGRVEGRVAIGSPRTFGRFWLRPRLAPLLAAHEGLRLQIGFGTPSELEPRLVDGTLDLVLLVRPPELPGIEAVPICTETFVVVASPAYLARFGTPRTVEDFRRHRWLRFDRDAAMHRPWWRASFGRDAPPVTDVICEIASLEEMADLVEDGVALAVLPDYLVADAVAADRLVVLAPEDGRPSRGTIHLAWRHGAVASARFRAVQAALGGASATPSVSAAPSGSGQATSS